MPGPSTEIIRYVAPSNNRFNRDEEYLTKKKIEVKTTTNTERRIQRQVVLEDGRVLSRNDPEIIVDTVEDTETHESEHTNVPEGVVKRLLDPKNIIKDSFKRTTNTRDYKENVTSTRFSKDLGLVSKRAVRQALKNSGDAENVIRKTLQTTRKDVTRSDPTVTYQAESRKKIVDTTDVHEISHVEKDGKVKSETFKTETHEIFDDRQIPNTSSSSSSSSNSSGKSIRETQKYSYGKTDNFTDYYKNSRKVGEGPRMTSENRDFSKETNHDWSRVEAKIRKNREMMKIQDAVAEREDALTKRPLNFVHEEKTRRKETDKWLEQHFGSDWSLSSSNNSNKGIRRTMSFSSVHNPNMSRLVKQTTTTYNPESGEEKVVYTTMSRIDPKVNVSTLSLPIKVSVAEKKNSSSSSSNEGDNKLLHDRVSRLRSEHASRSRIKKKSANHSTVVDKSSSTSKLNRIEQHPVENTKTVSTSNRRSKSSQPLYRTELRRDQFYPLESTFRLKTTPTTSEDDEPAAGNRYFSPSYRALERSDATEQSVHTLPLQRTKKKIIESQTTKQRQRRSESVSRRPINTTTHNQAVKRREYISPRKRMERSESNQRKSESDARLYSNVTRNSSNSIKKTESHRHHGSLVKTQSSGSSSNHTEYSKKVYHEHPLVEAEVKRLDNNSTDKILEKYHSHNSGGFGSRWWGKLSPHRRSASTAKLHQIATPMSKFGGSVRDLYFSSPSTSKQQHYSGEHDAQKFKTIIFLSGK